MTWSGLFRGSGRSSRWQRPISPLRFAARRRRLAVMSEQPNLLLRRKRRGFFGRNGILDWSGGNGPGENFNFLFGVGQAISAAFTQTHAFLVMVEKLFQRQLGVFHVRDDLFEAGEQVLKFFRRISGIGGRREQLA